MEGLKRDRGPSGPSLARMQGVLRGKRKSKRAVHRDGGSGETLERNGRGEGRRKGAGPRRTRLVHGTERLNWPRTRGCLLKMFCIR